MPSFRAILAGCVALAIAAGAGCDQDVPPSEPIIVGYTPAPLTMRRLLARQYVNTIEDVFGPDAAALANPPTDPSINGFKSIASAQLSLNDGLVSDYENSARAVATAAVVDTARLDSLAGCHPSRPDDEACMRQFVAQLGRRLFRRPLQNDELDDYQAVGKRAADYTRDFYAGTQLVIAAMLQSPNFLFQIETGIPATPGSNIRLLTAYELASRLSFFLLDQAPDEELLALAEAGALNTPDGIREVARDLLHRGAAAKAVRAYFREYLMLDNLTTLAKDPAVFPEFSPAMALSMERETLKLVDDVVFVRNAPLHELFTAPYTFVDAQLAPLYAVAPPSDASWHRVTLPTAQGRMGILGHASILSRQAHTNSTSATYRGLFIMERFLCTSMPPPPDDVVTDLPPSSTAPTLRDRLQVHLEKPSCRACHYTSDNLGLALENFDGIGRFRNNENGAAIDASAQVAQLGPFVGLSGLAPLLASSEQVMECMVKQVYRHASGHVESVDELPAIMELAGRFRDSGYSFQELLIELVASPLFRSFDFNIQAVAGIPTPARAAEPSQPVDTSVLTVTNQVQP